MVDKNVGLVAAPHHCTDHCYLNLVVVRTVCMDSPPYWRCLFCVQDTCKLLSMVVTPLSHSLIKKKEEKK